MKNFILTLFLLVSVHFSFGQEVDTTMIVNGVCEMCQETIEKAALVKGVKNASWSPETKILQVTFDPEKTNLEKIGLAINASGYDTEYAAAPEWAYEKLHGCCKYRDPKVIEAHEKKVHGQ
ncbi:MAG: cation transporter [Bacteroidota bacterium]|nr:cation transporter [Bacteroidota bacterium]MDX5428543.1 cation transporter [Bacteroidota bacterium]MDX5448932.1 cation transporter [Bacteroidota bacterium]MDX5506303.1 cation transporter [Bacteroidota bacterium]